MSEKHALTGGVDRRLLVSTAALVHFGFDRYLFGFDRYRFGFDNPFGFALSFLSDKQPNIAANTRHNANGP